MVALVGGTKAAVVGRRLDDLKVYEIFSHRGALCCQKTFDCSCDLT